MPHKLDLKDAGQQLCDELAVLGFNLAYSNALDIVARLEGYANWRYYLQTTGGAKGLFNLHLVYLSGFADKGYWWTRAEADPWLVGAQGADFDGPFATDELAKANALSRHPLAAVLPYNPESQIIPGTYHWEPVSVFAKVRVFVPMSAEVTRIAQNPGGDERRAMNDSFIFEPRYAQKNGRVVGLSWRSPLKFNGVDTTRKKAYFDFDVRIELSKPPGLDVSVLLNGMSYGARFSDDREPPEIQLLSWQ